MNDIFSTNSPLKVPKYRYRRQYKIRHLTSNNSTGEVFGVTIPNYVAENFKGVSFSIFFNNEMIILKSGNSIYNSKEEDMDGNE